MEPARLIEALSQPAAYPHPVDQVEVCHTHISAVFLAGPFAYKVKKPVALGFLDFRTLQSRHYFCEEEVRLNRRLAPSVYLGVVPVTNGPAGVRVEGRGQVVEWAVKMERLPEEATLRHRLEDEEVGGELLEDLARRLARFHAGADHGAHVSAFGRFEVVAGNARENFAQAAAQVGTTVSRAVFARLRTLTEESLARLRPLIEKRAAAGVPRDTHGDLRLEHVYLFPDRPPPADLVIVDCIEFNERFRYADPVADMAFLVMDLLFHGRGDLARSFAAAYFRAAGDPACRPLVLPACRPLVLDEGRALLGFYTAYRAAVRAKVEGFGLAEKEIPQAERAAALTRARAHWLLAVGELEQPDRKPCLVLVGGLPGVGKSTLASGLAERAGFCVVSTDRVRRELAGLPGEGGHPVGFEEGIYTPAWRERTYAECLRRVEGLLFEGKRVLVDASFREEARRREFLQAAVRWCVPAALLVCVAEPQVVRRRLATRKDDAAEADWAVHVQAARRWEEPGGRTRRFLKEVRTEDAEEALARSLEGLRALGIQSS
jgi:aminoglycoside phosphotransferase family enzyme/predicted kinase